MSNDNQFDPNRTDGEVVSPAEEVCCPEGIACNCEEVEETDEAPLTKGDPFCYHATSEECREELAELRLEFRFLRDLIVGDQDNPPMVPECRERSLAITHLQTAMMFAIAGLAINHEDSEPVS